VRMNSHQADAERAEAVFKKKQEKLREGQQAMAEYLADGRAVLEKTARLRALRLARDSADHRPSDRRPSDGARHTPSLPTKAKKRLVKKRLVSSAA
jgi:hypothetical protein